MALVFWTALAVFVLSLSGLVGTALFVNGSGPTRREEIVMAVLAVTAIASPVVMLIIGVYWLMVSGFV